MAAFVTLCGSAKNVAGLCDYLHLNINAFNLISHWESRFERFADKSLNRWISISEFFFKFPKISASNFEGIIPHFDLFLGFTFSLASTTTEFQVGTLAGFLKFIAETRWIHFSEIQKQQKIDEFNNLALFPPIHLPFAGVHQLYRANFNDLSFEEKLWIYFLNPKRKAHSISWKFQLGIQLADGEKIWIWNADSKNSYCSFKLPFFDLQNYIWNRLVKLETVWRIFWIFFSGITVKVI